MGRFALFFLSIVFLSLSQGLAVATRRPLTKHWHHVTGLVISTRRLFTEGRQDVTEIRMVTQEAEITGEECAVSFRPNSCRKQQCANSVHVTQTRGLISTNLRLCQHNSAVVFHGEVLVLSLRLIE